MMRAFLVQQGLLEALKGYFKSDKPITEKDKIGLLEKGLSCNCYESW